MQRLDVLRIEQKYTLGPREASRMVYLLSQILQRDSYSRNGSYMVRSLYFDTPDALDYFDKIDGLESRKKVRLRIYGIGDAPAKLELKQKQGSLQRKRSLTLSREQAEQVISGDLSCLEGCGEFGQSMRRLMDLGAYRPSCMVEYDRAAFFCPTNDTRITFDSCLRSNEGCFRLYDPSVQLTPVGSPGSVTMEVKYNHFLLSYIKDTLSAANMLSVSSSKYCSCRQFGLRGE